jgi:hypothetical protein
MELYCDAIITVYYSLSMQYCSDGTVKAALRRTPLSHGLMKQYLSVHFNFTNHEINDETVKLPDSGASRM